MALQIESKKGGQAVKTSAHKETVTIHRHTKIGKEESSDTEVIQGERIHFPEGFLIEAVGDSIKLSHDWNSAGTEVYVQVPVDVTKAGDKEILSALERADQLCAEHVSKHMGAMRDLLLNIKLPRK